MTRKPKPIPGHVSRSITVALERIVLAGEDPAHVVEDYGPWEWNRGPDLAVLVRLVALRDAVRAWMAAREESENDETRATDAVQKALKRAGGGRKR